MNTTDAINELRRSELSLSEVARRSGVSRNTLHLWLRGQARPQLSALEKVMLVLGKSIDVQLRPLSDPAAATAARVILGELNSPTPAVTAWIQRFNEWGDDNDTAIIARAAWGSNPLWRTGATHFLPGSALRIASAASASGQQWAVSEALEESNDRHPVTGSTLIWCEDITAVAAALPERVRRTPLPVLGGTSLIPATGTELSGTSMTAGISRTSPLQSAIDCLALAALKEGEN